MRLPLDNAGGTAAPEVRAGADHPVVAPDGLRLAVRRWRPRGAVRATVGILHGLYAHGGMFEEMATRLAARGFAAYAMDLRGHGRTPGQRGFAPAASAVRGDALAFLAALRRREPEAPPFLYGHSMGAMFALDAALTAEPAPRGVVVSGAPFAPAALPRPLRPVCRALSVVAPRLPLPTGAAAGRGVRDPELTARYATDALRQPFATPRLLDCMVTCGARVVAAAPGMTVPLLLQHGERDHVARPQGARAFLARVRNESVTARFYREGRHELHADRERDAVIEDVARWLEARLAAPRGVGDGEGPPKEAPWMERSAPTRS